MNHDNHIFIQAEQMDAPRAIKGETNREYLDRVGWEALEPKNVTWCLECSCKIWNDD
jgi:hypothetical protein